jgi:HAD superfamily hydrolase (TIGR01490 family)
MEKKVAAFFDLDGTIIKSHIERNFGFHLLMKKKITYKRFSSILFNEFKLNFDQKDKNIEIHKKIIFNLIENIDKPTFQVEFSMFYNEKLRDRVYPEVFRLVRKFKNSGIKVYIISSVIDPIVKEFSKNINADGYIATKLEEKNKCYTGKITDKIYLGKDKAKEIKELAGKEKISLKDSYAFGDYSQDSYILELVGKPIAVNPDKELMDIAIKRNWKIENWLLS